MQGRELGLSCAWNEPENACLFKANQASPKNPGLSFKFKEEVSIQPSGLMANWEMTSCMEGFPSEISLVDWKLTRPV